MKEHEVREIDGREVHWIEAEDAKPITWGEVAETYFNTVYGGDLDAFIDRVLARRERIQREQAALAAQG